jgi:hypothetical protein
MSPCTVSARKRARKCAETLAVREPVVGVDVLEPHADPTNCWTLDMTLDTRGVPPQVLDDLGSYQATLRDASPQGRAWKVLATL